MIDKHDEVGCDFFYVKGVAIKVERNYGITRTPALYKASRPARHENIRDTVNREFKINRKNINIIEGFYTDKHEFLTRKELMDLVQASPDKRYYMDREFWETKDPEMQSIYMW